MRSTIATSGDDGGGGGGGDDGFGVGGTCSASPGNGEGTGCVLPRVGDDPDCGGGDTPTTNRCRSSPTRRCRSRRPAPRSRASAAARRRRAIRLLVSLPSEMTTSAFLRRVPRLRQRHRLGDRVVDRGAADRLHGAERAADCATILRPALHQLRTRSRSDRGTLRRCGPSRSNRKRFSAALRGDDLLADHAAAGVERDAEAHRHALGIELRDRLRLAVFVGS